MPRPDLPGTSGSWGLPTEMYRLDQTTKCARAGQVLWTAACVLTLIWSGFGEAQEFGSRQSVQRGGELSFEPEGRGVIFGALDPTVQRWYIPEELFNEYRWRQAEYSNYGRHHYQRYVDTALEGDYFYDFFGDFVSRGFLVYDWRQEQPLGDGSSVFKGDKFSGWFSNLTIARDSQGDRAYALTVGSQIRTTLTPLTFSKAAFDGVQIDFASNRYTATILGSRISNPIILAQAQADQQTNSTSMLGGRGEVLVGDFITLGGTFVDARNSNTALEFVNADLVAGNLTSGQSATPVTAIAVILSDDSPDDGVAGAALFDHDVRITTRDFETGQDVVWTLADVVRPGSEWPQVFGGFERGGFTTADGDELIIVNYDFTDPGFQFPPETDLDETNIVDVEFDYVLGNDYKVEIWSNKQPGRARSFRGVSLAGVPSPPITRDIVEGGLALLTVARAGGNVTDISNIQRVKFDYGLPTANVVAGMTIEGVDLWGIDFYGEWDRNFRYSQYPNAPLFIANEGHKISRRTADARYMTVSKQDYPFFLYGEGYALDDDYSTSSFVVDTEGNLEYDDVQSHVYEFVDDNDDQDSIPDWLRSGSRSSDTNVFPGWDENNDFISDFNQNDNSSVENTVPDYEEPFLRHDVERPEFLFGIDLNNNGWVDRFENDELPDYPYKADRRGINVFGGMHLTPDTKITVGRLDERMISDDRNNTTTYAIATIERDYPAFGRLRVLDMLKRAEDTIPDDRRAVSPFRGAGPPPLVEDILPAQDTWVNTAWLGFDYTAIANLKVVNKLKYEIYNNRSDEPRDVSGRPMKSSPSLFGLVNKVEYNYVTRGLSVHPKLKSEYLRRDAFVKAERDQKQWTGIATLITQFPVLSQSSLSLGLELAQFNDRIEDEDEMLDLGTVGETGDVRSLNAALQLTNHSNYLGYRLTSQIGFRLARIFTEKVQLADRADGTFEKVSEGTTETTGFLTVYAGK